MKPHLSSCYSVCGNNNNSNHAKNDIWIILTCMYTIELHTLLLLMNIFRHKGSSIVSKVKNCKHGADETTLKVNVVEIQQESAAHTKNCDKRESETFLIDHKR